MLLQWIFLNLKKGISFSNREKKNRNIFLFSNQINESAVIEFIYPSYNFNSVLCFHV